MKSIIFTEDQFQSVEDIRNALFCDEKDPRSLSYIRKLNRPEINWLRVIICLLVPVVMMSVAVLCIVFCNVPVSAALLIAFVSITAYILITLKPAIICGIKIYQRYAPDSLRNKCRFEPSCSEYMIQAIRKYGVFKGVRKGIKRLKRCNINGGGFDFP